MPHSYTPKHCSIGSQGEEHRGHNLRALLTLLSEHLAAQGFPEEAERIQRYIRANRRALAELEEGHTRAVYGVYEYSLEQARTLVDHARKLIALLRDIEQRVLGTA